MSEKNLKSKYGVGDVVNIEVEVVSVIFTKDAAGRKDIIKYRMKTTSKDTFYDTVVVEEDCIQD